jgi:hypothetical protein
MELRYEQAMEEYGLTMKDLPEDAKIGIDNINNVLKGINMLQKRGKSVGDKTMKKLAAMDKWVYYEILDSVQGTDDNEEEIPYDDDEVIDEAESDAFSVGNNSSSEEGEEEEEEEEENNDNDGQQKMIPDFSEEELQKLGVKIDEDLRIAYEKGVKQVTIDELKSFSKSAYNLIFDSYTNDGNNGVVTSNFTLLEIEDSVFELNKK